MNANVGYNELAHMQKLFYVNVQRGRISVHKFHFIPPSLSSHKHTIWVYVFRNGQQNHAKV
jgi:hypothetical protein